ncbi:MAG TPA: hypothetical protein VF965_09340 [Candidatus Limnocylindria bacterium]
MSFDISPGERMLWEGKPQRLRGFLRPMDVFLLVFILFVGFFFATATAASGSRDGSLPFVFFFPVIFFGFFLVGPRILSVMRESSGARYAVTDRRVLIRNRGRFVELDLATLPYLEMDQSWLAGPTIYFGQRQMYEGWGGMYGGSPAPAFRGLADADTVYRTISDARARARGR